MCEREHIISVVFTILFLVSVNQCSARARDAPPNVVNLTDQMPSILIRTPGHPEQNYPPNFYAAYIVNGLVGNSIAMIIEKFQIQKSDGCDKDYMDIKDGKKSYTYCGRQPRRAINFDTTQLNITFVSDMFVEDTGFLIRLALIKPKCYCGEPNFATVGSRIYGGQELSPKHKYPWLVSIGDEQSSHLCGGALISDRYILTAAHCFKDEKGQFNSALNTRITFSAHSLEKDTKQVVQPFDVILHDEYVNTGFNIRNDIALVRLAEPIVFNAQLRPICLPSKSMPGSYGNSTLIVSGWGKTQSGEVSDVPMEVQVPEVSFEKCKQLHGNRVKEGKVICAGGRKGEDSCVGDSGGPLITPSTDRKSMFLVGIVSFGDTCGEANKYGVYTKVSHYMDWITENTQDGLSCPREGEDVKTELTCGLPKASSRVNGGVNVPVQAMPWMAAIGYNDSLLGGGTLIAPNFVITTTSNLNRLQRRPGFNLKLMAVILGTSDLSKSSATTRSYQVVRIITSTENANVAILKLNGVKEEFDRLFVPICLPAVTIDQTRLLDFMSAGWGRIAPNGQSSQFLKRIDMFRLSDRQCINFYQDTFKPHRDICVGSPFAGLCEGDEGAPLMYLNNGRVHLAGLLPLTSPAACDIKKPLVFNSLNSSLDWIKKEISG